MSNGDILKGILDLDPIPLQINYDLLLIPKNRVRYLTRHAEQANKSVLSTVTGEQLSGKLIGDELAIFFDDGMLGSIQSDKINKLQIGDQSRARTSKFSSMIASHSEDHFYAELTTTEFVIQTTYGICTLNIQTIERIEFKGDREIIAKIKFNQSAGKIHGILNDANINLMTEWGQPLTLHASELASITTVSEMLPISSIQTKKTEADQCRGENSCQSINKNLISFDDQLKDGRLGPDLLIIPAGTYVMGSPASEVGREIDEHQHSVSIDRPFTMSRFEITFTEYDYFANATQRAKPYDQGWGRASRPVVNVSVVDAMAYAHWLSLKTGKKYRLPTEAEWEYAARAGVKTAYWWGNEIDFYKTICDGCGSQWDNLSTAPVGMFLSNDFGLHDMLGNVKELTCSRYVQIYNGSEKHCAKNLLDNTFVAIRGGSWKNHPFRLRAAAREKLIANESNEMIGFRLVREL